MNLNRLLTFVWKELLKLSRDRVVIIFVLYAFSGDIIVKAQGLRFSLSNAGLRVLDYDRSTASRELSGRFATLYFSLRPAPQDEEELLKRIDDGDDRLGLVVPPDFEADLRRGERAPVQLFLDGSRAALAALAEAYTREIVSDLSLDVAIQRLGLPPDAEKSLPMITPALRVRFNPNRDETVFGGLNDMLMMMMMSLLAVALPAAALIREREHGTIEQLLVSPLAPWEIMLAKTTASTIILLAGAALAIFGVLLPIFAIPVRGSLTLFFACAAIFVFTMAGLGLTVGSLCRTMPQVAMVTIVVQAPILFLSGAWTPPEAMPGWLAAATVLSPLRWFNEIAFGVFLRGATLRDLAPPIGAMSGLGLLFFVRGALRFWARFR